MSVDFCNISEPDCVGESLLINPNSIVVYLAVKMIVETKPSPVRAKRKAADAGKEVKVVGHSYSTRAMPSSAASWCTSSMSKPHSVVVQAASLFGMVSPLMLVKG